MSILIKGMEMPTDCHNCPLGFGGGCYCGTSADEYLCPDHGRADFCPLVPVPPHGRLIDADVLFEFVESAYKTAQGDARRAYRDILDTIVAAGDVFPAEEGTE